jgi:KamA family protein
MTTRVIRHPSQIPAFPVERLRELEPVLREFQFRVSAYYAQLIDWHNPLDPLARIVLPDPDELVSMLDLDPSNEADNTPVTGLQHKYGPTALLLVTDVCAAFCRFCFRKRFTLSTAARSREVASGPDGPRREATLDLAAAMDYIRRHPEITNVLVSGGDPLMLAPSRLEQVLAALRSIPHVQTIRIGSKVPAFDPDRITPELVSVLSSAGSSGARVYVATHFSHPRELTPQAHAAIDRMLAADVIPYNQTPLLRGVNDDVDVLVRLLGSLSDAGVAPYYLFQCRPVTGNERFTFSIQRGLALVTQVRPRLGGLAKRFRYIASHSRGKIEIVGINEGQIIFRYHQARDPQDDGRIFTCPADTPVFWPDDAVPARAGAALRATTPE